MDKLLYKISILILKILPFILGIIYLLGSVFAIYGIDTVWLSYIGFTGVIPFIFIYISSFVFKFCVWHRIPMYYILGLNIFIYLDYLLIFSSTLLLLGIILLTGLSIILIIHFKNYGRKQNIKKLSNASNK